MRKQKVFNLGLKTFLFLSPIFFFKDFQPSFARGMFFVMGSFALYGLSLGLKPKRKFSNIWVSLFFLLALVRVFFDNGENIEAEWFNFWMSCAGFIYVFCGVLLFKTVYCHAGNIKEYFKPIVFVCVLNVVLVIFQIFVADFMWKASIYTSGFMGTNNQLGQYSVMVLPILYYLHPALAIFPVFTFLAAKEISPGLALSMGVAFLLWHYHKKWLLLAFFIFILAFSGFNHKWILGKFSNRPALWKKTITLALQKPYLGWGYQSFNSKIIDFEKGKTIGTRSPLRANNDYLHTAQELGFPILIVLGMFFLNLYRKFMADRKDKLTVFLASSVIIVLVNMAGQPLIRYAAISGTFIILLAFLCIKLEEKNADTQISNER